MSVILIYLTLCFLLLCLAYILYSSLMVFIIRCPAEDYNAILSDRFIDQ